MAVASADGPPWEWVEGDPVEVARYAMVVGVFLGVALTLLAVLITAAAFAVASGTVVFTPPYWLPFVGLVPVFGVEYLLLNAWPRWRPIVARIGISPLGLRLAFPRREIRLGWDSELVVGSNWVQGRFFLRLCRYRLTSRQSERLRRFVRAG